MNGVELFGSIFALRQHQSRHPDIESWGAHTAYLRIIFGPPGCSLADVRKGAVWMAGVLSYLVGTP